MTEVPRRRRRVRHAPTESVVEPPPPPVAETTPVHDPEPTPGIPVRPVQAPVHVSVPPAQVPSAEDREAERGLRGLVGAGSSQVSVAAAMRARDAARPSPEELAAAESDLTIVRRHWVPRDPLTR